MGLSKGTAKWLKIGAGAAALGLSFTNPIGWCADLSGAAAIGANLASGVVMGAVSDKFKKTADKAIDDNTDKDKKSAGSKEPTTAKSTVSDASKASATSEADATATPDTATTASTDTTTDSSNPFKELEGLIANLFGGNAVNSNGQSVSSTVNKFSNDTSQLQSDSGKNLQAAAETNGLATGSDLKVHEL